MTTDFSRTSETVAFRISTLDGSVYFVNVDGDLHIEEGFVVINDDDLMIYDTLDENKQPIKGFIKVGQYLGMDDSVYVEMTGASISRVESNTDLGKAIIEARSGLVS